MAAPTLTDQRHPHQLGTREHPRTVESPGVPLSVLRTIRDYCRERWGWNRDRSDQLIRAAGLSVQLYGLGAPAPSSERQARELVGPIGRSCGLSVVMCTVVLTKHLGG